MRRNKIKASIRRAASEERVDPKGKKKTLVSLMHALPDHDAVEQIEGFVQRELSRKFQPHDLARSGKLRRSRRWQDQRRLDSLESPGLVADSSAPPEDSPATRGTVDGVGSMAGRRGARVELRLLP